MGRALGKTVKTPANGPSLASQDSETRESIVTRRNAKSGDAFLK